MVFELTISHQRYTWKVYKRYNELIDLHNRVKRVLFEGGHNIHPPKSKMKLVWNRHNVKILRKRGEETAKYLENLGTIEQLWQSKELMEFLEISKVGLLCIWLSHSYRMCVIVTPFGTVRLTSINV